MKISSYLMVKQQKIWMTVFVSILLLGLASSSVFAVTLYVAKTGSDSNPGTQAQPFLTINKAAQMAYAGDTVIVGAGVYRECVQPLRGGTSEANRITYKAADGATVSIKGSEQITNWTQYSGNTWKVTLPNSYFGSYNPYNSFHGSGESGWIPNYTCGDVYFNGEAYYEKFSTSNVTSSGNTWYCQVDSSNTTIYANFNGANPNTGLAEINVRKQCFVPSTWGLGYITVSGFTVAHAANSYSDFPGYPVHAQAGAISVYGGLKWIIENCSVINARSIGIDVGLSCDEWAGNKGSAVRTYYYNTDKYGQHIVRNNFIQKCGQSGICGVFSWKSQLLYNTVDGTNYRNEFTGSETGGIKLHYDNDGLIEGNYVKNTVGNAGIWTDWGNQGIRITKNLSVNNGNCYYAEAIHGPILIDNNVFVGGSYRVFDSGGLVFVHNLFYNVSADYVNSSGRDCYLFTPHTMNATTVKSAAQYFHWFNNIFIGCSMVTPPGTNNEVNYNCSNVGSGFTYNSTSTSFTCNFNMDGSPFTTHPLITDAFIGNIQPANQGIGVTVDKDYFGSNINTGAPVAGPFADIKNGSNSYTLWPRSGGPTPPPQPTPTPNLALNQPVTVSSTADNCPGPNAVDGNDGSRWSSAYTENEWIYVDLGSPKTLSSVRLNWEAAYGKSYKIQVSNNALDWNEVSSITNGDGGVDQIYINTSARYVKMLGIQRGTPYGYSLWEFEVYGANGGTPTPTPTVTSPVSTPTPTRTPSSSVTPTRTPTPTSGGILFQTGLESGNTQPTWVDSIEVSTNVIGYLTGINPECSVRNGETSHSGTTSLMFSGNDNNATTSFCYFKVFDVNIPITSSTKLSYWFYPQMELARGVAVDFVCTDGTTLRDCGATDQNGISMHPGHSRGTVNAWNQVQCNIGQWLNGKTIDRILVGYDMGPSTGQFRGFIDDIQINN